MATRKELLDTPIEQYRFSRRARNCFSASGTRYKLWVFETVGDVVVRSGEELLEIKNLGKITLRHIREVLAKDRLYLRDEEPPNHTPEWPGDPRVGRVPDYTE